MSVQTAASLAETIALPVIPGGPGEPPDDAAERDARGLAVLVDLAVEPDSLALMSAVAGPAGEQPQRARVPSIVALIPAHNEAALIAQTIRSLQRQTRPVTRIIVICDNCTDDTEAVAVVEGAEVLVTAGNKARKAGALNQALPEVLRSLSPHDLVLVMDADSRLNISWLASAAAVLQIDRHVGASCGVFLGEPGSGLLGQVQRNEFRRYARSIHRRRQPFVLSGTGTLFRTSVLREIARERGRRLPGKPAQIYSEQSITEDNEITLAIKSLGWKCLSPPACRTVTEVMPSWGDLWKQRMRWQAGALSDLGRYGVTRVTVPYWLRQALLYTGFVAMYLCMAILAGSEAFHPGVSLVWGGGILVVNAVERTWTTRLAGWRGMTLAVLVLPELLYSLFLAAVFFWALRSHLLRRELLWHHLAHGRVS